MPKNTKDSEQMDSSFCSCSNCPSNMMGGRHFKHRRCPLKFLKGIVFLIFFVFLTVLLGMQIWGRPWYKDIRAEFTSTPYARTITVNGEGKITIKPDIAMVTLTVSSAGKTVAEVTADGNKKMTNIIAEMKTLGIKAEDIQTSEYNLYPRYDYGSTVSGTYRPTTPTILGYSLDQSVNVKIRNLEKSDQVLDRAIQAGANQVSSLTFDMDDASSVKKDARKMAFDKAREKAEEMSKAAGVSLGRVITFSEDNYGGIMPYANFSMKADMAMATAESVSIEPGSKEFTVNVSVTYEIN